MGFLVSVAQKMELEPKNEGGGGQGVFFLSSSPPPRSFACPMFFYDSHSSFFSPKPQRNACYAVYG